MLDKAALTKADIKDLCDHAVAAWDLASQRARKVRFSWRGMKFTSHLTNFRMLVDGPNGEPVAARYLDWRD